MDEERPPERDPAHTDPDHETAEALERYRSLFAHSPYATFSLDLEGRYTDANAAAQRVAGLTLEQLRGTDFTHVVHPEDLELARKAFDAGLAREPQQFEARILQPSGEVLENHVTVIPVIVGDHVVGVHGVAEDVTEANRLRRELESSAAAKVLFLANASHEIRTPLTTVIGMTELLLESDLPPHPDRLATVIHRSGQRLMRLVNEILDYTQLESGASRLRLAPIQVGDLVDSLSADALPSAEQAGLSFTSTVEENVPPVLLGDVGRLSQVLRNLIENAVKFTTVGGVSLRVSLVSRPAHDAERAAVRFDVTDTGVGIAEVDMSSVFEPFVQADPSATRAHDGVGLGLAICRDLAHLMQGDLTVTSEPGAGSRFCFTLPLIVPPATAGVIEAD